MARTQRPSKRAKLLSDDEASSSESEVEGQNGVKVAEGAANGFKINEEFAKRFEHNKKMQEKFRLEEKFKNDKGEKRKRDDDGDEDDEDEDSSEDESEDDDAELATADLDAEIMDTLQAIKNKDPRVYDSSVNFYRDFAPEQDATNGTAKKEKPMTLQDYHRKNLLAGYTGGQEDTDASVWTYQQEQDALKKQVVGAMHGEVQADDEDDEDDFLVAKSKPQHDDLPAASKPKKITEDDIATADKDPETFLSNFMAARAWLPTEGSRFAALDSDDSEEEKRADEFEEAYNMRFEDPAKANEKLLSFARDVGKHSVRREEKSGRKKIREREREKKEAEKRQREEERARLRKLKIEEAEEKVNRIRVAAGLKGKDIDLEKWRDIIEGDFDDDQWDQEMKRKFGHQYYAEYEGGDDSDVEMEDAGAAKKKGKAKKPKWDDDIDIKDLVPDFKDDDENPGITLTDDEDDAEGGAPLPQDGDDDEEVSVKAKKKTKKDRLQEKAEAKRAARKQRMKIEEMVDNNLPLSRPSLAFSKTPVAGFRYRETSPTSFGLSARDILFADDSALNQFAGLKKLTAFRDDEKKRKDKKKLGKKARLRQWRKETFGKEDEPAGGFGRILGGASNANAAELGGEKQKETSAADGVDENVREGDRKKKRRSKKKAKTSESEV
ncbi:Krr1-domain-containing protein [Teratosphaeria nubilosa]|uniref:Krr1-domain-containing protein n=1 Tax=Teratosphaeria nubilosa TaxID=161662 RepID=A0A6G1L4Z8_9PEZI|nr:Krr1-domain-containing protein [Teratosphaeria nubilosa]